MNNEPNQAAEEPQSAPEYRGTATYCPEDNKLRLYVGRVPREDYLKLRAAGWKALHKQREAGGGDFVAIWTPERRDLALEWCGIIEDEDMGPAERAADRAERFGGYRDKRADEAGERADRYDAGPSAHGFQSQARAERAAARHDRIADRAGDAWSKAEYWQRRTAGVISHALHVASPDVRMGRIKELEAAIRKSEKEFEDRARNWRNWCKLAALTDWTIQTEHVRHYVGSTNQWADYKHPRADKLSDYYKNNEVSLYSLATHETDPLSGAELCALFFSDHREPKIENDDWLTHYRLRLAYENQMLEAQGGRAAFVEMQVGGWIGQSQIRKIVKSPATGRVTSVEIMATVRRDFYDRDAGKTVERVTKGPKLINIERCAADIYRPPTPEDVAAMAALKKSEKAARPKVATIPLVNPTDADAERLVALWNANRRADHDAKNTYRSEEARKMHAEQFKPCEVRRMPQAFYSAHSKGSYAKAETQGLCSLGRLNERNAFYDYSGQAQRAAERGPAVCQIRTTGFNPVHVVILTDKPQKPLPAAVWRKHTPAVVEETVNA